MPVELEMTGRQYGNNPSEKDNIVPKVVRFDKLPTKTWMPRDEYIQHGYRVSQASVGHCLESLWYIHNETVNIWSHLLGAIFMLALLMWTFFPDLYSGYHFSLADIRLVQFYLVCSAGCLLFSSAYHCAICHSEQVAHRCLKLDYLGIILSITATNISTIYFAFYDQKVIASTYITASSVLAIGTFWAVIDPCADGPNSALWRAIIFSSLGITGLVALIHSLLTLTTVSGYAMVYMTGGGSLYLLGAAIYVNRFPERVWPGTFDIWGASHQIFHIVFCVGQMLHLWGLKTALLHHYVQDV